jgi:hypothetical protein
MTPLIGVLLLRRACWAHQDVAGAPAAVLLAGRTFCRAPARPEGLAAGNGSPRALHFVRAHLRLRLGRVELVRPHWRGDAQLGIKRPAYLVAP